MKAKIGYGLVISIGIIGMILTLVWLISGTDDPLTLPATILSMLIVLIGVLCLTEERRAK